ncbi:MAG: hypothetical protein RL095_528 [Verrucomicrobiota bacterium]|jgi:fumarylacetoacetate (FAA) hydrolase
MKLASLKHHRDGQLIVVSRDLKRAVGAASIAPTLQAALDDWKAVEPRLRQLADKLEKGEAPGAFELDQNLLDAPLPRAYNWCDGSAYVVHVELVRKARGAELPPSFWTDPLMYQGGNEFMAAHEPIRLRDAAWGIDFESEICVLTSDVKQGATPEEAASSIALIGLVNDVSLRNLIPDELAKGFGFFQSKPASTMSPVLCTPDELGSHWREGRLHLPLSTWRNGELFGCPDAGPDMIFSFPQLIAHAAKTRNLEAGSVIGSGTVANRDEAKGSSCIAEKRCRETIASGKPSTPFLQFGESVRISMALPDGSLPFGTIEQKVEQIAT